MSNVKVNSSSDFSLAFDLSAALRVSSAACAIPKGPERMSGSAHTWQQQPVALSGRTNQGQELTLPNIYFKETVLHICVYEGQDGPSLCHFFFLPVILISRRKPKINDSQGSSVPPGTASPFDTSHFLGAWDGSSSSSRRCLDLTVWGLRCLLTLLK